MLTLARKTITLKVRYYKIEASNMRDFCNEFRELHVISKLPLGTKIHLNTCSCIQIVPESRFEILHESRQNI